MGRRMKNLISSKNKQKGLSSFGWIVIVGLFALLIISVLKVFPMYYENYKVKAVLESLSLDSDMDPTSKRAIWESLSKRLYIQEAQTVQRDHVSMSRKDDKTTVTIAYETRDSYFGNLFIGAKFSESVVIER
jgi:Tfp pilus assembly major pilin PilA